MGQGPWVPAPSVFSRRERNSLRPAAEEKYRRQSASLASSLNCPRTQQRPRTAGPPVPTQGQGDEHPHGPSSPSVELTHLISHFRDFKEDGLNEVFGLVWRGGLWSV